MHGFSDELNFSFLRGSTVEQVCLGQYETQLRLYPEGHITLEGKYIHKIGAREIVQERDSCGTNELFRLLGQDITRVAAMPPRSFAISFSNGDELILIDDSDQHESFLIASPNGLIVI
jgi:hypothetical protein